MKDNKTRVKKSIEGDGVGERSKIKDTFYFDYLLSIDNQIFWESICTSTVVHSSCEQASWVIAMLDKDLVDASEGEEKQSSEHNNTWARERINNLRIQPG